MMVSNADELVQVQVLVPRSSVPEFYERHALWLRSKLSNPEEVWRDLQSAESILRNVRFLPQEGQLEFKAFKRPHPQLSLDYLVEEAAADVAEAAPRPWDASLSSNGASGDELADAILIYDKLSPGAKKIVDALLKSPGVRISGESLSRQLGLSQAQLNGTLASVGIRSKAVNREQPVRYEPGIDGGSYWIEPAVAIVLQWAREQPANVVQVAARYDDTRHLLAEKSNHREVMMTEEERGRGFDVDDVETRLIHANMETDYALVRRFSEAMNLPEPEESVLLRELRRYLYPDGAREEQEGGANGQS